MEVQAVVEEEVIAPSVTPAEPVTVVEPSMAADAPTVSASPDFDQRIEERYYQYRETNAVEYNTHGGLAGFKEASHHFVGLGMAENDAMLLTHALTTQDSNLYHTLLDQYPAVKEIAEQSQEEALQEEKTLEPKTLASETLETPETTADIFVNRMQAAYDLNNDPNSSAEDRIRSLYENGVDVQQFAYDLGSGLRDNYTITNVNDDTQFMIGDTIITGKAEYDNEAHAQGNPGIYKVQPTADDSIEFTVSQQDQHLHIQPPEGAHKLIINNIAAGYEPGMLPDQTQLLGIEISDPLQALRIYNDKSLAQETISPALEQEALQVREQQKEDLYEQYPPQPMNITARRGEQHGMLQQPTDQIIVDGKPVAGTAYRYSDNQYYLKNEESLFRLTVANDQQLIVEHIAPNQQSSDKAIISNVPIKEMSHPLSSLTELHLSPEKATGQKLELTQEQTEQLNQNVKAKDENVVQVVNKIGREIGM